MYELHFAVPFAGAILNNINTRLDARTVSVILRHANSTLVFVDCASRDLVLEALSLFPENQSQRPTLILITDNTVQEEKTKTSPTVDNFLHTYEGLVSKGDPGFKWVLPNSEWDPMVLNYTSGTTSSPKGVVHCHRGTFIISVDTLIDWAVPKNPGEWNKLPATERARLKARQGVRTAGMAEVDVVGPTGESVKRDGVSIGEVVMRGGCVMLGYLKDPSGTASCFKNGWFYTGDVGVMHEDGYLEIKDRSKDVIISGGENLSSVEVESVIRASGGERGGGGGEAARVLGRDAVRVYELPKTSTGKIQKFVLRQIAKEMGSFTQSRI
ncbi:Putative acyl-activating enzyme 6 [Glycine soja]|nr:Putative acyl-activating enzyme 6 [Glycine soja]